MNDLIDRLRAENPFPSTFGVTPPDIDSMLSKAAPSNSGPTHSQAHRRQPRPRRVAVTTILASLIAVASGALVYVNRSQGTGDGVVAVSVDTPSPPRLLPSWVPKGMKIVDAGDSKFDAFNNPSTTRKFELIATDASGRTRLRVTPVTVEQASLAALFTVTITDGPVDATLVTGSPDSGIATKPNESNLFFQWKGRPTLDRTSQKRRHQRRARR